MVVVGGETQHGKVDRWREREREMSTKIRLQAKICLDLTENESKCDANGSGLDNFRQSNVNWVRSKTVYEYTPVPE